MQRPDTGEWGAGRPASQNRRCEVKDKLLKLTGPVALAIALVLTVVYVLDAQLWTVEEPTEEAGAQTYSTACYREQGGVKWVAGSGCEWEMESGATFDLQSGVDADIATTLNMNNNPITNIGAAGTDFGSDGSLTTAAGVTLSDGDIVVADDVRVTAQTAITVTNAAAFTATGTYQGIQAAGEVTPTITAGTVGDLLVLINVGAETINIADTGTQKLSAAWAGGADDVLVLWSDGTNWIEISRSAN
jgi:hypothetical protein